MGLTPCKAEQPLQNMEPRRKEENDKKDLGKVFRKIPIKKRCILTLKLKPFRLVKGKHSAGKKLQGLAVGRKK